MLNIYPLNQHVNFWQLFLVLVIAWLLCALFKKRTVVREEPDEYSESGEPAIFQLKRVPFIKTTMVFLNGMLMHADHNYTWISTGLDLASVAKVNKFRFIGSNFGEGDRVLVCYQWRLIDQGW